MNLSPFEEFDLSPELLKALEKKGYTRPTAIQLEAIPAAMEEHDVLGSAPTGTGKTAAFLLPAIQHLLDYPRRKPGAPRILILTPTRELAMQVAEQAEENFKASPWHNRLHLTRQDVQTYCQQTAYQFDLIVANPPYFTQGVECKNDERALARYVQQSHLDWLNWAASCLSEKGKISFVLPYEAGKTLINSTALCCIKQTDVITKTGKDPQRILLTFSREHLPQVKDSLVIYNENNQYTEEFIALTKAFYLKM